MANLSKNSLVKAGRLQPRQNIGDILTAIWDWLNIPMPVIVDNIADWMGLVADVVGYYSIIRNEFFANSDHEEIKELIQDLSSKQEEMEDDMMDMVEEQNQAETTTEPYFKYFMRRY